MINREGIIDYLKRKYVFNGIVRELKIKPIKDKITTLIGPRRAGKTYYFYYLMNHYKKTLYLNFENIFLKSIHAAEFFEILKIYQEIYGYEPRVLFLDEIQELNDWQTLLRTLLDYKYMIFVSGSSSKLLSKEIATQLRGRTITYSLFPFSFREFLKAKNVSIGKDLSFKEKGLVLNYLREYLKFGGFPEVCLIDDVNKKEILLKSYFDEIFLKDFMERHEIRSIDVGRFLFELIFQNYSNELNIKKIFNYIKSKVAVSKKTIYQYLDHLQDTLSVFFLDRFSLSVYSRKGWPKKVYIVDIGLSLPLTFSEDIGKKMENIVFLELLRKTNESLIQIYYLKEQDYEIDFIIKEKDKIKELIQVSYINSPDEINERELKAFIKFNKLNHSNPKHTIITWDYEAKKEFKWFNKNVKVDFVPLWKWLLNF